MKFLAALIPSLMNLVIKILTLFGFTFLTYVGLDKIVFMFKSEIASYVNGVPADMLQLFYLAGGGAALNIIFGGFSFWLSVQILSKLTTRFKLSGG
ncbi:DUF2523 domain-containing protein [Wielerella bovis]|uniref:DUF2523 domain-containing protein n=1 Tax=Wielerella bovis TaxID=2917790 RepID=UPI002019D687|nr:DUF2523 domain-containing protein [Wielerella bovis]ULJ62384.1 DUF2523 domain-containing protein [Wielerella bovis]